MDHELHMDAGVVRITDAGGAHFATFGPGDEPVELIEVGHLGPDGTFHEGVVLGEPAALAVVGPDGSLEIRVTGVVRAVLRVPVPADETPLGS